MANKDGLFARLTSFYKTADGQHDIPHLYFFYGGEYLHYGGDPVPRIPEFPSWTSRESREKAP
ncbi:hypothetical protein GCM10022222_21350 [Amycolatopsis ultiminotia]|uniref:Uncharacterized protein n=1 Tax=Amycolatopsis ultiminotia TaxID=543629 RepID=A0ABP6VM58_9PSEU